MNVLRNTFTSIVTILAWSPAYGAVVSNSANSGVTFGQDELAVVTLDLFDDSLGTLTGVFFEYDMRAEAVYFLRPRNAASGGATANNDFVGFNVSSFGPGLTSFPVLQDRDGDAFSTTDIFNYSQFVEGSDSGSIARNINGWTGQGTSDLEFRLQLLQLDSTSTNIISDFRDVSYDVSVKVTYTFDPTPIVPVPLPAGGLLLLSGIVGIAGLRRRRILRGMM